MLGRFSFAAALTVFSLSLGLPSLRAAEDVLKLVPDGAMGFAVLNRPGDLDAKIQAFAQSMQMPPMSLLAMGKQRLGIREGLDEKGTAAAILLPPNDKANIGAPILLVPVTDYAKFIEPFKPEAQAGGLSKIRIDQTPALVRQIGGYAALAEPTQKQALTEGIKVAPAVPAGLVQWQKWLAGKDVAVVILPAGVKRLMIQAREGIETAKAGMPKDTNIAKGMTAALDMYLNFFRTVEREITAVGQGAQLDRQGAIRIVTRGMLAPGGQWARLAKWPAAEQDPLAGVPAGPFMVAMGFGSPATLEALSQVSVDMAKNMYGMYGLNKEQSEKVAEISRQSMKSLRGMSLVMGGDKSSSAIFARMVSVMRVDDSKTFMGDYEKTIQEYSKVIKNAQGSILPPMEIQKTEIAGAAGFQITTQFPKVPGMAGQEDAAKMMDAFFGPGGKMIIWVAPADKQHVVIGYVNKEAARQTIETIRQGKKGLAGDPQITKTAALLPKGAPVVAYLSPTGTVNFAKSIFERITSAGGSAVPSIPDFPLTPPVGFAATTAPGEVSTHVVLPAELLRAIGPYAAKVQAAQGGEQ